MMTGLWSAKFNSSIMTGAGVVVFTGNQILGGDGGYYYAGILDITGSSFTTLLKVAPHSPGYQSVFGTTGQIFHLQLSGTWQEGSTTILAKGTPREFPAMEFQVTLTKIV